MAEIIIVDERSAAGEIVADAIERLVALRPDAVLGYATGSTPLPVYGALAQRVADGRLDLSSTTGFALDEYVGLPDGHPQSYRSVIGAEVVRPLGLNPSKVYVPSGMPHLLATAGDDFEAAIDAAGGIDLQILGIGTTGHIGFNEPGSSLSSRTRVKTLVEQTRADNARFFGSIDDVPRHCVTQGLGTILRSRHAVLLAFGSGKARAVAAAVEGPVTASLPGSVIQLHPHATVIIDEEAAAELVNTDYYRYTWTNKPHGQGL